jgi:galactose mutarotase-like enzyme
VTTEVVLSSPAEGGIEARFVPDVGMLAGSLRHRGEELLGQRSGLAAYVAERKTMGIPLLYPWANRLSVMRFALAGREVALDTIAPPLRMDEHGLPMHGFLAGVAGWEVERAEPGALTARFDLAAHEDLVSAFPFPHELVYEATLVGPTLTITTTVLASRGAPVPIAFGFHPYFVLPGVPRAEWEVHAPVTEQLRLDHHMLPTGETVGAHVPEGPLHHSTFDDAFLAPADGAPFVLAGGGRRVEVSFDAGYPYAQVFAPAADDVIAFEPMTAPADALASGQDLRILAPGERFDAAFSITVTDA